MKAMVIEEYGDADAFIGTQVSDPVPRAGEVLVRIEATSVNQVDLLTRSMGPPLAPGLPAILHSDVAGVIEAVGPGVTAFKPGDAVYGCVGGVAGSPGTLADLVAADADLLAPKPATLAMAEAAALPLVAITAWQAVVERGRVAEGHKVLVYGGAGGVGHLAVQIAKHAGATVVATASTGDKARVARELGADEVVDAKTVPVADIVRDFTDGGGFDVVIDTVGGGHLPEAFRAAKLGGDVVTTIGLGAVDLSEAHMRALSVHVVFMLVPLLHGVGRAGHGKILREVAALVDAGAVRPLIDPRRFAISDVGRAHALMEEGGHVGKIVLVQG